MSPRKRTVAMATAVVGGFSFPVARLSTAQGADGPVAAEVEKRVDAILAKLTLEEKIDAIGGVDSFYVRALPRLGLPAIRMADGPFGVRNVGPSTTYAAGLALAASWDVELGRRVGSMIGLDARARGVEIMLAPGVNIYRAPFCGRNFEYLGEDPFLAARMAVSYIEGIQSQGVSATIKHFLANNSETDRHHTSSEIDARTMREIYLPAFEAAVKEARVGALMTSYNLVNGVHMTQNADLIDRLLKQEWGFDGIVMSDWDATYDGVAAANAGLDLEMPSGRFMNRETLRPAVQAGQVSVATIDDKVRRILRDAVRFGWLDRPATDVRAPLYNQAGGAVALEGARAGIVLLKNERDLLPLDRKKLKSLAVIGPDAYPALPVGGGSAQVRPFAAVSFLQGLADRLPKTNVRFNRGVPTLAEIFDSTEFSTAATGGKPGLTGEYFDDPRLAGRPALTRVDEHLDFAWERLNPWPTGQRKESSARWTGVYTAAATGDHLFVAWCYGLDQYRVFVDGKLVLDRAQSPQPIATARLALRAGQAYAVRVEYLHADHHARVGFGIRHADLLVDPKAAELARNADAAVVLAGFDPMTEAEGYDRTFELPLGQDELISAVRAANPKLVVALTSGGGVDMTRWEDGVPAILETFYAGQEAGTALAEILLGDVNPSGKLPVSFERRLADDAVSVHGSYAPGPDKKIAYREGVFVGYRHFDQTGIAPLFPFGHGLSYTRFQYRGLEISPKKAAAGDATIRVSFEIANTGKRAGAEIAQVYVGDKHAPVPRPPKELKGFAKVALAPGQKKRVTLALDRRAFSYFDVGTTRWRVAPGSFEILVGSSSRKIELRGRVTLP